MNFPSNDLKQLQLRNIGQETATRQLNLLRTGQVDIKLDRPCIPGDGIVQIQQTSYDYLTRAFSAAAEAGRLQRFVPASGAASRMFSPLHADTETLEACRTEQASRQATQAELDLRRFLDELPSFAFYADLAKTMEEDGSDLEQAREERAAGQIIRCLLETSGLGYSRLPKGLLAFHRSPDGARTPFIEHLAEAALLNGLDGVVKLHFTVSEEHLALFKAQLAAWQAVLGETYGCSFDVSYSTQKPSTDTLAIDDNGQPLRDADGDLVLRPGGHGALIENLNDLDGDIVLIRNIDNVVPDAHKECNLLWTKLLTGYLVEIQQEQHALLKALNEQPDDPMVRELAVSFLADRLQTEVPFSEGSSKLMDLLDRPLRVCGMVVNSGEPGGGPFWVRETDGKTTRQIVEGAQIDKQDTEQADILARSTHFNPVDMVCAVRDWRGNRYDLTRFVDDEAVIITSKMQNGKEIRVLERPGLWNGGMSGWHTVFVDIPPEAFNPVKTVFDLLRPAHQL